MHVPSGCGWLGNRLLRLGYWLLPLVALLFIAFWGMPESPNAALDRLAAAPWWHTPPKPTATGDWLTVVEKAARPDLQRFAIWGGKMLVFYGMIGLSFWATLVPRTQITRKASGRLRGIALSGHVIYLAFSLLFVLCCLLLPVIALVPSAAPIIIAPMGLTCILAVALYLLLLLLLDFVLPLLQLATFSVYGLAWVRLARKVIQAIAFLRQWLGFNAEGAPIPQILALLVGTLLVKVYGLGWGIIILAGLSLVIALVIDLAIDLTMLFSALVKWLWESLKPLLGWLGFLLALPFIIGSEKYQDWRRCRVKKRP